MAGAQGSGFLRPPVPCPGSSRCRQAGKGLPQAGTDMPRQQAWGRPLLPPAAALGEAQAAARMPGALPVRRVGAELGCSSLLSWPQQQGGSRVLSGAPRPSLALRGSGGGDPRSNPSPERRQERASQDPRGAARSKVPPLAQLDPPVCGCGGAGSSPALQRCSEQPAGLVLNLPHPGSSSLLWGPPHVGVFPRPPGSRGSEKAGTAPCVHSAGGGRLAGARRKAVIQTSTT